MKKSIWLSAILLLSLPALAQQLSPHAEFRARLTAPVSTAANRKGDKVAAFVISPRAFAGATLEGEVADCNGKGFFHSNAVLRLRFKTLHAHGGVIAITSEVKAMSNSKGKADQDEQGAAFDPASGSAADGEQEKELAFAPGTVFVLEVSEASKSSH